MLLQTQEYVSSVCLPEADSRPPFKYAGLAKEEGTSDVILGAIRKTQYPFDMMSMTATPSSTILSPSEMMLERPSVLGRTTSQGSIGKAAWKMESEDSSYDSDYENSDVLSPQPDSSDLRKSGDSSAQHDEVSRTVSDTLAAEYAEYVNTRNVAAGSSPSSPSAVSGSGKFDNSGKQILTPSAESTAFLQLQSGVALEGDADEDEQDEAAMEAILLDPSYTSRVEFALKLGYTERQVQLALHKLGPQPGQNELLAELIKLGAMASCSRSSEGSSGGSSQGKDMFAEDMSGGDTSVSSSGDLRQLLASRQECMDPSSNLRPIVIDGSNVAMSHGNKEVFSCRGIKLCVDWFKARGHKDITVFVPKWRKELSRPDARITDQDILLDLEKERRLVFTPSRFVGGRRLVCYDDRYILKLAAETDGIVVSNDTYRDLANENPEYKKVVDERLLMYSFVNDRFMPPDDPLGRHGPNLENFLRKHSKIPESLLPPCPYGKKCTYGNKCKYYHPERGNQPQKSVTERLQEQAKLQIQEVKARGNKSRDSSPGDSLKMKLTGTVSAPASSERILLKKTPLSRTKSVIPSMLLTKDLIEASASTAGSELGSKSSASDDSQQHNEPIGTSILPPYRCSPDVPPSSNYLGASQFQQPSAGLQNLWSPVGQNQGWAHSNIRHPSMQPIGPSPPSSRLFSSDHGGHLSVAKRLSDPDNKSESNSGPNLHRKLQRQLTLNPTCDPRLFQDCKCVHPAHIPLQSASALKGSRLCTTTEGDPLASHSMGVHDPMLHMGGHRPLSRHNSATEPHNLPSSMLPPQMCWDKASRMTMPTVDSIHTTVTRIASAPDSYCQWPAAHGRNPPMQRLNSTSDSQLNLAHDSSSAYYGGALYDSERHGWALHRLAHMGAAAAAAASPWHHEAPTGNIPRPHTPLGHMSQQPMRPSSVPPHQVGLSGQQMPVQYSGDNSRNCLYFHLSSIFPQEQVQAAMMMFPEDVEITPQDLCARILSMFPPRTQ